MAELTMPRRLRDAGFRFVIALSLLTALAHGIGMQLIPALLPVFRAQIGWLDENYRVRDVRYINDGGNRLIALEVSVARYFVLGGRLIEPDPQGRARATTLAANLFVPAILCFSIVAAWPVRRMRDHARRVLLALPCVAAIMLMDVPFVLWGEVWSLHVAAMEPDRFSPLLSWVDFMQGGGRLVLGLAAGIISVYETVTLA